MKTLPAFRGPGQCWARYVHLNQAPGPWFISYPSQIRYLVFGWPAIGDCVYNPESELVEVYLGAQEEQNP